jgi:hypothetical protein
MALPKLDCITYDLTLPLSKKQIRFRPFLVKEQRNLLIAMESDDKETIEKNIKQVIQNCTISPVLDIDTLPILDVEFYFINLRARSVGEVVESKYRCENDVDGVICNNIMETNFNLLDIKVDFDENIKDVIQLSDSISIKFKYPQYSILKASNDMQSLNDIAFAMIIDSIDYIYDGQQFFYAKEAQPNELVDFVESLNTEQFSKIQEFFENLPKLNKDINIKCSKCGHNHDIAVEGLESFFA